MRSEALQQHRDRLIGIAFPSGLLKLALPVMSTSVEKSPSAIQSAHPRHWLQP